jgi:hypothetical protein
MENKAKVDNQLISGRGIVKKPGKTRKKPGKNPQLCFEGFC